tara:strand:+ start:61 stop:414 length:354 start_codon:yes stop_codon:yes gene_type:complete
MNRYQNIPAFLGKDTNQESKSSLSNIKYPEIPLDSSDTYVYTTRGDRYDILAQQYYGDHTLWWVIARANPNQTPDSLIPNIGSQLRIPSSNRISNIITKYENLNSQSPNDLNSLLNF